MRGRWRAGLKNRCWTIRKQRRWLIRCRQCWHNQSARCRGGLAQGKLDSRLVVHLALRARKYDAYAQKFLTKYPDGVVVNLGCGMDTRFFRVDNGHFHLYDLDLPEVITLKRQLLQETDRYHFIGQSVLDFEWIEELKEVWGKRPLLFLAEGLFMYLQPVPVKDLVLKLRETFPGSESGV